MASRSLANSLFVTGQSLVSTQSVNLWPISSTQRVRQWQVTRLRRVCLAMASHSLSHWVSVSGKSLDCTGTVHGRLVVSDKCLPCTRASDRQWQVSALHPKLVKWICKVQSVMRMLKVVERPARRFRMVNWHTVLARRRDFQNLSLFLLEVHSARRSFLALKKKDNKGLISEYRSNKAIL